MRSDAAERVPTEAQRFIVQSSVEPRSVGAKDKAKTPNVPFIFILILRPTGLSICPLQADMAIMRPCHPHP